MARAGRPACWTTGLGRRERGTTASSLPMLPYSALPLADRARASCSMAAAAASSFALSAGEARLPSALHSASPRHSSPPASSPVRHDSAFALRGGCRRLRRRRDLDLHLRLGWRAVEQAPRPVCGYRSSCIPLYLAFGGRYGTMAFLVAVAATALKTANWHCRAG